MISAERHACRLLAVACLALGLAAAGQAMSADASGRDGAGGVAPMEREAVRRVNEIRQEHGLTPLETDRALAETARDHSCRMARQHFFQHEAPDGETVAERVRKAGKSFHLVGENLARNVNAADPVATVVQGWMKSPGHRENILRPGFTRTGVGICRGHPGFYFTQVFLQPRA